MEVITELIGAATSGERILPLFLLTTLGIDMPKTARILDFGCGDGETVRALRASGYAGAEGYDVSNYRGASDVVHRQHVTTGTLLNLELPYDDDSFDLVISDQVFEHVQDPVRAFEELYRVTKPGGHQIHIFPARYTPLEVHLHVPFGGAVQHLWWYRLWASLGIRNRYQQGLSAAETATYNAYFATEATRYVSSSCYGAVWSTIGFDYRFIERDFLTTHRRRILRLLGGLRPAAWLYRTFRSRVVYLHKPAT